MFHAKTLFSPIFVCFCFLSLLGYRQSQAAVYSTPTQALLTSCPAAGSARAAFMPALNSLGHPNVIYTSHGKEGHFLRRYDTVTRQKTTLIQLPDDDYLATARVSPDGHWIIFTTRIQQQQELRLLRIDGRYLQTLYCAPFISTILFAPDQKHLLVSRLYESQQYDGISTDSIDLITGESHVVLRQTHPLSGYEPIKWASNSSVYLTEALTGVGGAGPFPLRNRTNLYLLQDITKSQHEQSTNLKLLLATGDKPACLDFDSTPDTASLLTSTCTQTSTAQTTAQTGPSSIQLHHNGNTHTLYSLPNKAITYIRAISNDTLLFVVSDLHYTYKKDFSLNTKGEEQNGLWRIHINGTGLKRLYATPSGAAIDFPQFGYTTADIIAPTGKLYALQTNLFGARNRNSSLVVGQLSGGLPTTIETTKQASILYLIGWGNA